MKLLKYFFNYELFIISGLMMTILSFAKLMGIYDLSSDWFWFITGVCFVIQGTIMFIKQRTFDKKYKIILRKGGKKAVSSK